jgi:hypothetical protein
MTEKSVTIVPPEGYEIDNEKSSFSHIVFKPVEATPEPLPRKWQDLLNIHGYYVTAFSEVSRTGPVPATHNNRGAFPTKAEAEACIALAQLCQLRDAYNGQTGLAGCSATLVTRNASAEVPRSNFVFRFKTVELRDEFKENFADLLEIARPLLG